MLQWEYISDKHQELISNFECEDEPSVKDFLVNDALKYHNLNVAKTKLYFDNEDNFVGYFTLYNDMMTIGRKKRRKHGLSELPPYKYYPSIKLHYLGVDSRFRDRRYGEFLLISVFNLAKKMAAESGCIFITVESLKSSVGFYSKYQFHRLSISGIYQNMFFKIAELL